jgi:hypothetical protein
LVKHLHLEVRVEHLGGVRRKAGTGESLGALSEQLVQCPLPSGVPVGVVWMLTLELRLTKGKGKTANSDAKEPQFRRAVIGLYLLSY